MNKLNPGDIAPETAYYMICDKNGNCIDQVAVKKGQRLPPTQSEEYYYEISD